MLFSSKPLRKASSAQELSSISKAAKGQREKRGKMTQKSLDVRIANLEGANAESKRKLAEAKATIQALEKDLAARKQDESGLERVKAEIGRTLDSVVAELEMAKLEELGKELCEKILNKTVEIDMLIKEGLEISTKNLDKIAQTGEDIRAREKTIKENLGKIEAIDKDIEKGFEAMDNVVKIGKDREMLRERIEALRDLNIQKPENSE